MSIDDTLAAWGAAVQLDGAVAERIYQDVVTAPVAERVPVAGLDPGWWRNFSADLARTVVHSTRPPRVAA